MSLRRHFRAIGNSQAAPLDFPRPQLALGPAVLAPSEPFQWLGRRNLSAESNSALLSLLNSLDRFGGGRRAGALMTAWIGFSRAPRMGTNGPRAFGFARTERMLLPGREVPEGAKPRRQVERTPVEMIAPPHMARTGFGPS